MKPGLGTQLRHLTDLLDGAVGASHEEAGLDFRPRYTPVMRALGAELPCSVGRSAELAGVSQPSSTQTIGLMHTAGRVEAMPAAADGRQKLVRLSAPGRQMLHKLERCWNVMAAAAQGLDHELACPLSELLAQAVAALQERSFPARIRGANPAPKRKSAKPATPTPDRG
jgi:DNA-binding MarR family transcriptional regulator